LAALVIDYMNRSLPVFLVGDSYCVENSSLQVLSYATVFLKTKQKKVPMIITVSLRKCALSQCSEQ
jgi:hypothetical protein